MMMLLRVIQWPNTQSPEAHWEFRAGEVDMYDTEGEAGEMEERADGERPADQELVGLHHKIVKGKM